MKELSDLPNIGKVLANKLKQVGINNEHELKLIGSEKAILKIATLEQSGLVLICFMRWKVPFKVSAGMV